MTGGLPPHSSRYNISASGAPGCGDSPRSPAPSRRRISISTAYADGATRGTFNIRLIFFSKGTQAPTMDLSGCLLSAYPQEPGSGESAALVFCLSGHPEKPLVTPAPGVPAPPPCTINRASPPDPLASPIREGSAFRSRRSSRTRPITSEGSRACRPGSPARKASIIISTSSS